MVKSLPCNAGDSDSIPGRGARILHAMRQLTPPQLLSPHTLEPTYHNQRAPVLQGKILQDTTKARVPQLRPNTAKLINIVTNLRQKTNMTILVVEETSEI